ncbi:MauE/DoxX family redox-associated membrane protein [Longitalea luteola]|uniref:MauE/DoxX family redox-associated membrane protein n=1 Tax=Longitalea luteola TaxID=2812563 RepID=UPI001A976449|nr:MauE/DoxX family redox-associated membrane protein [Longitalea luteola]
MTYLHWLKNIGKPASGSPLLTVYNWITRNIKINYFLIFLFAYTAVSKLNLFSYTVPFSWESFKLVDVSSFKEAMSKSPVLRPYLHVLAWMIPASEIAACLLLLFNKTKIAGYYVSLLLLTLFTAYIIYILNAYSHNLPCVCGGVISLMSWTQHLLFNYFFIAITIRAIFIMLRSYRK